MNWQLEMLFVQDPISVKYYVSASCCWLMDFVCISFVKEAVVVRFDRNGGIHPVPGFMGRDERDIE